MSNDKVNKLTGDLKQVDEKLQKDKQSSTSKKTTKESTKETAKRGRGRPVTGKSKTAGIEAGTHVKSILILPVELHKELQVEAIRDDNKDMSDIITDILKERYNIK